MQVIIKGVTQGRGDHDEREGNMKALACMWLNNGKSETKVERGGLLPIVP